MKHMKVMKIKPSMLFMPFVVNPLFMPRGAGCRHGNLTRKFGHWNITMKIKVSILFMPFVVNPFSCCVVPTVGMEI